MSNYPTSSQVLETAGQHVPVVVHTKIPGIPTQTTIESAVAIASDDRVFHHVALLSEAFKKPRIANPAGSIVATAHHIIPELMDAAPNCGMRLVATDLTDSDVDSPEKLDILFETLKAVVPTRRYIGTSVPLEVGLATFLEGSQPVAKHFNVRTENEVKNIQDQGNLFAGLPGGKRPKLDDIKRLIPANIQRLARHRLGIMGATGSHFLSLVKADKILDDQSAKRLGISSGQYLFYLHTGSGIIGRYIAHMYSAQRRRLSHSIGLGIGQLGFKNPHYLEVAARLKIDARRALLGFDADTRGGHMAALALAAAGNQGYANRTVLTHKIDLALETVLHRRVNLRLIYDAPHVFTACEKHFGQDVWVHRNGATRARMSEPALIAPFENSYGYAGVGRGSSSTFSSANHELGKRAGLSVETYKSLPKVKHQELPPVRVYTTKGNRVVSALPADAVYAEAVADEIEQNGIMDLAVRLRPLATLTYHRK